MDHNGEFTIQYNKGFNVHCQSKLLQRTVVLGASSDLGQPLCPRQIVEFILQTPFVLTEYNDKIKQSPVLLVAVYTWNHCNGHYWYYRKKYFILDNETK